MKKLLIALALVALAACKVEKTGKDTYKVVAPTPEAKAAGEKAKDEAKEAADKMKAAVHDATAPSTSDTSSTTQTTQTTSTSKDGTTTTTTTAKTSTHH